MCWSLFNEDMCRRRDETVQVNGHNFVAIEYAILRKIASSGSVALKGGAWLQRSNDVASFRRCSV